MPEPTQIHQQIKAGLLRFAASHPRSIDSLSGIAEFWVPGCNREYLANVVGELVASGLLARKRLAGRDHFAITPQFVALAKRKLGGSQ